MKPKPCHVSGNARRKRGSLTTKLQSATAQQYALKSYHTLEPNRFIARTKTLLGNNK